MKSRAPVRHSLVPALLTLSVAALSLTLYVSSTSAAAPGGGRGAGGAAAAPQPTLTIDTSKLDSSKTTDLPTVFPRENMGANLPRPKLPSMDEATPIAPFPDPFAW